MVTMVKQNVEVSREFMKWFEIQQMWREEGVEEGFSRGLAQGHAQGHAQGQQLEFFNTVKKLLFKGKTPEEIADLLDRRLSEIEEVINKECITL